MNELIQTLCNHIRDLPLTDRIEALNQVRLALHKVSPFQAEPVDCVLWLPSENVQANEYNPNAVARPEMELLHTSIKEDGITMPVVAMAKDTHDVPKEAEIVDGFHRNTTISTRSDIRNRTHGYTPVSLIQKDLAERMASTIRHNRARGEHGIEPMAAIVASLQEQGKTATEIAHDLGMEAEEVLRLMSIKGVAITLANHEYQRAWEVV